MKEIKYSELDVVQQKLLEEAANVMNTAYNPYSNFFVGAALLSQKGEVVTGSNVENASYGATICAERAAILRANAMGIRMFEKVAVIARGSDSETTQVTAPCGMCRQVLYEMAQISGIDMEVIMSTTKFDKIIVSTIKELLPLAFGPNDLGIDVKKYQ